MIDALVKVRALRGTVAGVGRELKAGEVAEVDALTAECLVAVGVAVLLDERDAQRLREALESNNARIAREARGTRRWMDR